jgi:hypothetical protein
VPTEPPYAARLTALVSTPLQEGQRNMNCSGRTPNLEMVRKCFMVSPQERHTMVRPLSGPKGERSITTVETVSYGMCVSTETGGSATGLSATDAWHEAAVGDDAYVRLNGAVARLNFRQKARNLDSTNGGQHPQKRKFGPAIGPHERSDTPNKSRERPGYRGACHRAGHFGPDPLAHAGYAKIQCPTSTVTPPPILRHASVPGIFRKPAP